MNRTVVLRRFVALLGLMILFANVTGCQRSTWTATELRDWYSQYANDSPDYGPLYYRGSDAEFHYFIIRALDEWVFIKVNRGELELEDERAPLAATSGRAGPFPGYYAVDPLDGFKKLKRRMAR